MFVLIKARSLRSLTYAPNWLLRDFDVVLLGGSGSRLPSGDGLGLPDDLVLVHGLLNRSHNHPIHREQNLGLDDTLVLFQIVLCLRLVGGGDLAQAVAKFGHPALADIVPRIHRRDEAFLERGSQFVGRRFLVQLGEVVTDYVGRERLILALRVGRFAPLRRAKRSEARRICNDARAKRASKNS